MLKHIVFWKLHEFAEGHDMEHNMDYVIKEVLEIQKELPLLKKIDCHKSIRRGDHFWDLVLEMEFESMEDAQKYQTYPRHVELHDFAVKVRKDRAVVDYIF